MRNFVRGAVRRLRPDPVQYTEPEPADVALPSDLTPDELEVYRKVEPYTMTSVERVVTLVRAVGYLVDNEIEGDFVECGVWRGGSMMAVAHALTMLGATGRRLLLFDTFSGMTAPSNKDARYDGNAAADLLA